MSMVSIRRKVYSLAKKLGATIEGGLEGHSWHYNIDAPSGKVWVCSGTHCLVATTSNGPVLWRTEMWLDLLELMRYGLDDCEDPYCEICGEL